MFRPGDLVDERYVVERALGSGSFGEVLAARSVADGERVALKMMLPEMMADQEIVLRFLREAQAAAQLESPHTARVLDVRRLKGGVPYLVMELLEGMDLERYVTQNGPLPIGEAVTLVAQACEALAEAHAAGVVHRDLKLANMFLIRGPDGSGHVKILDFGIAKMVHAPAQVALTASSVSFGSPQYMSPEQLRSTRDVDARSDLWSLGVCLYELLTAKMPFEGVSQPMLFAAILGGEPAPLRERRPEVPEELAAIVDRCLRKNPAERWQSAQEIKDALSAWTLAQGGRATGQLRMHASTQRMVSPVAAAPAGDVDGRTITQGEWEQLTGPRHRVPTQPSQLRQKEAGQPRASTFPLLPVVLGVVGLVVALTLAAVVGFWLGRAR